MDCDTLSLLRDKLRRRLDRGAVANARLVMARLAVATHPEHTKHRVRSHRRHVFDHPLVMQRPKDPKLQGCAAPGGGRIIL